MALRVSRGHRETVRGGVEVDAHGVAVADLPGEELAGELAPIAYCTSRRSGRAGTRASSFDGAILPRTRRAESIPQPCDNPRNLPRRP